MRRNLVMAVWLPLVIGCTRIPPVTPYVADSGVKYCRELNQKANDRETEEFLAGTVSAVAGAVVVATGIVLSASQSSNATWFEESQGLFLMVPGGLLLGAGLSTAFASSDSGRLSKQTREALRHEPFDDRAAYYECVAARGNWSNDVSDITRLQLELFKENRAAATAARDAAAAATARLAAVNETADEARKTANKANETAAVANQAAMISVFASRDLAAGTEKLIDGIVSKKDGAQAVDSAKATIADVKKKLESGPSPKPRESGTLPNSPR